MTREQALKQARKRWGNKALIRAYDHLSSPEKREAARVELEQAKAELEAVEKELTERLAACDWYQQLTARKRELRKAKELAGSRRSYKRFSVGENDMGLFYLVKGEGDTWEEAFAAADGKHQESPTDVHAITAQEN